MRKNTIIGVFVLCILFLLSGCNDNKPTRENGALPGLFSVSATKKVHFSIGNLSYDEAANTWRFESQQWNKSSIFAWRTNMDKITIVNGGKKSQLWRPLLRNELVYLFRYRTDAPRLFGLARIGEMNGCVLLPDNWQQTEDLPPFEPNLVYNEEKNCYLGEAEDGYGVNTYTEEQWALMEQAGAVFLPALDKGRYWTLAAPNETVAYALSFSANTLYPYGAFDKTDHYFLRLVRE